MRILLTYFFPIGISSVWKAWHYLFPCRNWEKRDGVLSNFDLELFSCLICVLNFDFIFYFCGENFIWRMLMWEDGFCRGRVAEGLEEMDGEDRSSFFLGTNVPLAAKYLYQYISILISFTLLPSILLVEVKLALSGGFCFLSRSSL